MSIINLLWISEPLITALIMVLVGKITFNLFFIPVIIVILVSAFGSEEFSPDQYTTMTTSMIVIELICYSFRNIGIKYLTDSETNEDYKNGDAEKNDDDEAEVNHASLEGVAGMFVCGLISLIPVWIYLISNGTVTMTEVWDRLDPLALVVALCHVNITFISLALVLAMFDPVKHALLNVGKNITIVLMFHLFIHQTDSTTHIISSLVCLVASIEGSKLIYQKASKKENEKDFKNQVLKKNIAGKDQLIFTI